MSIYFTGALLEKAQGEILIVLKSIAKFSLTSWGQAFTYLFLLLRSRHKQQWLFFFSFSVLSAGFFDRDVEQILLACKIIKMVSCHRYIFNTFKKKLCFCQKRKRKKNPEVNDSAGGGGKLLSKMVLHLNVSWENAKRACSVSICMSVCSWIKRTVT